MAHTATAVVLAGGRGTRSADPTAAKLAHVIGGRTLLDWHVELLAPSSVDRLLIAAGHLGDQVDDIASPYAATHPYVRVLHEER